MNGDAISGRAISFRIPESLAREVESAMETAGVLRMSDFTRQALVLRVREVNETAALRAKISKPVHFSRRHRTKKEAA